MGAAEVTAFLSWLATERNVAAATQNQALAALLFLYKVVLERDLPWFDDLVRAKRPVRLPLVLSAAEVRKLLEQLEGVTPKRFNEQVRRNHKRFPPGFMFMRTNQEVAILRS